MQSIRSISFFLIILALAVSAGASEQAGVSAAVRGDVKLWRKQVLGEPVASGEPIFMRDALKSEQRSGMQILLLDETVFTLGENSEIVIDEFVYDPRTAEGKLEAEVVKGAFRFISGKMKKQKPEDVQLQLPAGTIGIRGTMVAGVADPQTKGSLVALLGPGRNSNTGDEPGKLSVTNAGQTVTIERPNFATRIDGPNAPPSTPFQLSLAQIEGLTGALSSSGGRAGSRDAATSKGNEPTRDGGAETDAEESTPQVSASEQAGQETAVGAVLGDIVATTAQELGGIAALDTEAAQDAVLQGAFEVSTIQDLLTVPGGTGDYDGFDLPFEGGKGFFDARIDVDFNANQFTMDLYQIEIPHLGLVNGEFIGNQAPFGAGLGGEARYRFQGFAQECSPSCVGTSHFIDAAGLLYNVNGVIAGEAGVRMDVRAGGANGAIEAEADVQVPRTDTP